MSAFQPPAISLADHIHLHGKWRGHFPAVVFGDRLINWSELDSLTNKVGNGLKRLGVGPGDRVAVVMKNHPMTVAVLFGVMKAGACSVPLNLSITDDAVETMIKDSGSVVVFATADQAGRIDARREKLNTVDPDGFFIVGDTREGWTALEGWLDAQDASRPDATPDPDSPCNIIYSSGTTGLPKGITHSYKGRLEWAEDCALALHFSDVSRTLCSIGLYSNIMWAAMLATIRSGGSLLLHDGFDAARCLDDIKAQAVSHIVMVPIQFQRLLDEGATVEGLQSVITAVTVGSKMNTPLKRTIAQLMPGALMELWGLTEGILSVQTASEAASHPESVGRPLAGCDLMVLDENDEPCLPNEPGEVVGRARFVMQGYWNRADATRECQWTDEKGRIWLRTGDIGRLDGDGNLYIVDRKKDMIVSGGQNIYPQDIEAVLITHDDVADCAVIGIPHDKWEETPLALVVPKKTGTQKADDLMHWLNSRIGRQQRVSGVVLVDDLPRNPNGKILKRELRAAYDSGSLQ